MVYGIYGMNMKMNMNMNMKMEYEYIIYAFLPCLNTVLENEVKWKKRNGECLLKPLTILKPLTTKKY